MGFSIPPDAKSDLRSRWPHLRTLTLTFLIPVLFVPLAPAETSPTSAKTCLDPFTPAGRKHGVPPKLLYAVAKVESSENPMAMNVAGVRKDTRTPSEVAVEAAKAIRTGSSFDICLMQINVQWFKGQDPLEMLRLDNCVDKAAWLIGRLLKDHGGDMYEAIKRYHSPTSQRGMKYAKKVLAAWKTVDGPLCIDYLYGASPYLPPSP